MARARQKTAVTARLAMHERQVLEDTIDGLLARHRLAHRCPLRPEDLVTLWRANMGPVDQNFWTAAYLKLAAGDDLPITEPESQGVLLHFDFGKVCLQIPSEIFGANKFPIWDRREEMSLVQPLETLGPELYRELRDWAITAIHIHARVKLTKSTLKEILDLGNTIGQISRMAPELVKYASRQSRQALNEQERRSPLPDEWMMMDRTVVRSSLDHLTFCYLLPRVEDSDTESDKLPWVWDRCGLTDARYTSRPNFDFGAEMTVYKLPLDPNPMELGTFSLQE